MPDTEGTAPDNTARDVLAAAVSDEPAGIDLLAGVRRRLGARRVRARALLAGSVVAVVAAGGATIGVSASPAPAQSAQAALAAAAAQTAAQTYRVDGQFTYQGPPPGSVSGPTGPTIVNWSGVADPQHSEGELTDQFSDPDNPSGDGQEMWIGGNLYWHYTPPGSQAFGPWQETPGGVPLRLPDTVYPSIFLVLYPGLLIPTSSSASQGQVASPEDLLGALQSDGQVRQIGPASGSGWTGTLYSFTLKYGGPPTVTGTVAVDQMGQVRTVNISEPAVNTYIPAQSMKVEFSDFGVAVNVAAPASSQTVNGY